MKELWRRFYHKIRFYHIAYRFSDSHIIIDLAGISYAYTPYELFDAMSDIEYHQKAAVGCDSFTSTKIHVTCGTSPSLSAFAIKS